jgi:hypothetical protein
METNTSNMNQPPMKHSGLGIASFTLSILGAICIFATFVIAGFLGHNQTGGYYPGQTLVGFALIFFIFILILSLGLGIASIFQKGQKRVLGILGLVFSAGTLMLTVLLLIVGIWYITNRTELRKKTETPLTHASSLAPNASTHVSSKSVLWVDMAVKDRAC